MSMSMPLRVSDDAPGLSDLRDGLGDDLGVTLLHRRRDVDVEAVGADDRAGVVEDLVTHHDDMVDLAVGVDDAVPGGEGARRPADLVQCGGDLAVVLRMFVRENQVGCRLDAARLVAVHPLDLGRPLPAFVGEVELERSDSLGISAGERVLDGRLPPEFAQLIGHDWQISLLTCAKVLQLA